MGGKSGYFVNILFSLNMVCLIWMIIHFSNINEGCIKKVCEYTKIAPYGCEIRIKSKNYVCETNNPCPEDQNMPCYIFKDDSCPMIGSCHNYQNMTQLIICIIFWICVCIIWILYVSYRSNKRKNNDMQNFV